MTAMASTRTLTDGKQTAPEIPPRSWLREYLETIIACVLVLLFARTFVFMQSKIPTGSMLETLQIGDYILVDLFAYSAPLDAPVPWLGQREIRRGDVVVFRFPEDPDVDFVKRVIGLPGDMVEVVNGRAVVNGKPLDEPYVRLDPTVPANRNATPVVVPNDRYFVMGDNRDNSRDSRAWRFLPRSLVKGRAFFIWYSFDEAPNDHLNTGLKRPVSIAHKVLYFFTRTRWRRLFSLIR
jgi:signal peptidase I